ncbi:MAG: hypothetical protein KIS88_01305 [Anaerolineales bacterium]|nr:hypothetical protein [Anaerolineales bacterium]
MAKKRAKKSSGLNLSAPKQVTWVISAILGVLGLLGHFAILPLGSYAFALVAIGFVVLALATAVSGL